MTTIPTTFDALFSRYGAPYGIPLAFMRALAWMESGMDPANVTRAKNPDNDHVGLFQAGKENLADWDAAAKRAGYVVPAGEWHEWLKDPELNTRVFVRTMRRMMASFSAGGLASDWTWDDYPALLTMGWNAGWSKKSGVRRVLDYLRGKGLPLDYATVAAKAKEAGAKGTLSSSKKQAWHQGVVALYRRLEVAPTDPIGPSAADKLRDLAAAIKTSVIRSRAADWLWLALLVGGAVLAERKSSRGIFNW